MNDEIQPAMNDLEQFRDAIRSAGLEPPDAIEADGKLRRFATNGKRGDDAGWYVLHGDGIPAGSFGDWRTGVSASWRADIGRTLTPGKDAAHRAKVKVMQCEREAEEVRRKAEAASKAAAIWKAAQPGPDDHPYLTRKSIKSHGARLHDGTLAIPMRDGAGLLHSLQSIGPDGDKRFLTGGRVAGCYFSIGNPKGAAALCIVEGFATGATIYEATGYPVAVAFNAGNLEPVARALRIKFPDLQLILCADDDTATDGNPGLTKATAAALAVAGKLAVPDFGAARPDGFSDFNDMMALCGAEAVTHAIAEARTPAGKSENGSRQAGNGQGNGKTRTPITVRISDVQREEVSWLWNDRIPRGKLTIVEGDPGEGKSFLSQAIAASITLGAGFPGDTKRREPETVIIMSAEDGLSDTIRPRLEDMGAALANVIALRGMTDEKGQEAFLTLNDLDVIEKAIVEFKPGLVIIDPIIAYVAGADTHRANEVRALLAPLAALAEKHKCAILAVRHLNKSAAKAYYRGQGSIDFLAACRSAFLVAEDPETPGQKVLCHIKSNLGPLTPSLTFSITDGRFLWGDESPLTAEMLLAIPIEGAERNKLNEAKTFLEEVLANGAVGRDVIEREARGAGIPPATLNRAKTALGIKPRKVSFESGWIWELPDRRCSSIGVITLGRNDPLEDEKNSTKSPKVIIDAEGDQAVGVRGVDHLREFEEI